MLLGKSACAFTMSAERFFAQHLDVYFWTFTFKSVPYNDDDAMEQWNTFSKRLKKHFPFIEGLRVAELHRSHGIHFHFFLNERVPIGRMRKIIRGSGHLAGRNHYLDFGRLSVERADRDSIGYLAKYLRKGYRREWPFKKRRWGAIGGFRTTRCNDLCYESEATRNRTRIFGRHPCGYGALLMITRLTVVYGHVDEWPGKMRALVMAQPLNKQQITLAEKLVRDGVHDPF